MGMYDQPSSGVSSWRVIRVVLGFVLVGLKFAVAGRGCSGSSSSYHYSDYSTPDYSNLAGNYPDYNSLAGASVPSRVEMPGMSLYAPHGDTAIITGDRASGDAKPASDDDLWSVQWSEGSGMSPRAALEVFKTLTDSKDTIHASEIRDAVVGGADAAQLTLTDGTTSEGIVVSAVSCNGRIVLIHAGSYSGSQAAANAIVETFSCDAPPPPQGPTLAEKKGWTADDYGTGYTNPHDVYVSTYGMAGSLADDPFGMVGASNAFTSFTVTSEKPTKKGGKYTWTGMYEADDGSKRPGAVTAWECGDLRIAITSVSSPSRKYVAEGQAFAATAKCE